MKRLKEGNKETMNLLLPEDAEEAPMSTNSMNMKNSDESVDLLGFGSKASKQIPNDVQSKETNNDYLSIKLKLP